MEVWRRSRRRREHGEKTRDEGGGSEEAALRTRTMERPVRRQSGRGRGRRETYTEGKTKKETEGNGGERRRRGGGERVRDGRDQPSQLQRERTASLANHSRFSSRVAILFRNRAVRRERSAEKSSSHHRSFQVIGAGFYGASRYSADLSSSTTKGWDRIGRDERHSLQHLIDLNVPAERFLTF